MNNGKYDTESYKIGQAAKIDRLWGVKKDHDKVCECCNINFIWHGRELTKQFKKVRFCSRSCANNRQTMWDNKIDVIGETEGKFRYRKLAIKIHGNRCVVCHFDKLVEVHHLDHNRRNNSKENLVPLCPNHHMMIHRSKFAEEVKRDINNYLGGLV